MPFLFYIDNQLTDRPENDDALTTSIKRDSQLAALLITQDVELVYNGNNALQTGQVSGYALLKDAFDSGTCNELELIVYDQVSATETFLHYSGVIKVPQIQIEEHRVLATTKVQDNSFYSYVNNNKNIEFNIQSNRTKNRQAITPCQIYEVDLFNSFTGVYGSTIGNYYRGYRVYDVFKYLIAAISDNKVGFESFYLQNTTNLFMFDGFALGNANTDPNVKVTFEKLYREIYKARNVSFYVDQTDPDNPVLRLESFASLFSGVQVLAFDDIKELKSRIRTDRIYGAIRVGAEYNPGGSNPLIYTFNAGTSYQGWMNEVYAPLGQCNVDNEFNLMSDFIITSNAIQDQVVGGATDHDDDLFLIECDGVDTTLFTAIAIDYPAWASTSSALFYNQGLNNPSKLQVHASNYQTGLTNTLEIGGNGFQASLGQELLLGTYDPASPAYAFPFYLIDPLVFADETTGSNYDGGGNYDNTTGIYVAPLTGNYSFSTKLLIDAVNILQCIGAGVIENATVGIQVVNSPTLTATSYPTNLVRGFTILQVITVYTDNTLAVVVSQTGITQRITENLTLAPYVINSMPALTAGQAVTTHIVVVADVFAPQIFGNTPIREINNLPNWSVGTIGCVVPSFARPALYAATTSTFSCTGAPDGGGIVIDNDPALYKSKEFEFTFAISASEWQSIVANPTGLFTFEKDGITRTGWIQEMQHNDWTGETQIKLITSDDATT